MTKTVKDHFEACRDVSKLIDDANALATKLQAELKVSRAAFEALVDFQHPKLMMDYPYEMRRNNDLKNGTPATVIKSQIERINALLGDRA